ncbi:MAG: putative inorganic carbon transporter subunit DabA, partial [Algoriphagus sp.]
MHLHSTCEVMSVEQILHELKHFLPAQAPLKDFVHHNTLHAFQHLPFFQGLKQANDQFGYKGFLSLDEYRSLYRDGRIKELVLKKILEEQFGDQADSWLVKLLDESTDDFPSPKIGQFRAHWRNDDHFNLDKTIHPFLFRLLSAYLDQGISIWPFPLEAKGFLDSIRQLQVGSYSSIFK